MVEGGALLTPEFKTFAEGYVPFLHVTTRIPGRENENLLGEVGGTGFPHFAFLDAEGEVLATHRGPRSAEAFAETGKTAQEAMALEKRAAEGDADAVVDLTLTKAADGRIKLAEFKKKLAGKEMTAEQKGRYEKLLPKLKFEEIQKTAKGAAYWKLHKATDFAPDDTRAATEFFLEIMTFAEYTENVAAFEGALGKIKELHGENPQARGFIENAEAKLAEMKAE